MHQYHYLTIEQREALEKLIRARIAGGPRLDTAIERLHRPDFGVCIECSKDIEFVRLQADPLAMHCRNCSRMPVSPDQ